MACCAISCPCPSSVSCCRDDCVRPVAPLVASASFDDPAPLFAALARDDTTMQRLADECLAYAMTHGVAMLKHDAASDSRTIVHAPVTLLPHRLEQTIFDEVVQLARDFNALYECVSRDTEWLLSSLHAAGEMDPFLARLLGLLREVATGPAAARQQQLHLAINRSDYLMHADRHNDNEDAPANNSARRASRRPLQVEFNCISAGAGSLSHRTCDMHRFLVDRYLASGPTPLRLNLPTNPVITNLTSAMSHAHQLFLQQQRATLPPSQSAIVLFVVQAAEANMADQRLLEYGLWEDHGVSVVRMTLAEIDTRASLDALGRLWLRTADIAGTTSHAQLVSLVYFRAGYTPRDFPSEVEWRALGLVERSLAIKCPRLAYHLSGAKKVQQLLAEPGVIERFACSTHAVRRMRRCFARLDTPNEESVARALRQPSEYVLKPQREGGGNNLWGDDLVRTLRTSTMRELQAFILMERIRPRRPHSDAHDDAHAESAADDPPRPALKFGRLVTVPRPLSELGIMGAMITGVAEEEEKAAAEVDTNTTSDWSPADSAAVAPAASSSCLASACRSRVRRLLCYRNEYIGYLLRTKDDSLNEGGLMSGAGAIDSLVLIP